MLPWAGGVSAGGGVHPGVARTRLPPVAPRSSNLAPVKPMCARAACQDDPLSLARAPPPAVPPAAARRAACAANGILLDLGHFKDLHDTDLQELPAGPPSAAQEHRASARGQGR